MKDSLYLGALGLLPKNAFSRVVGAAAHAPLPSPVSQLAIRSFAKAFDIDLSEAERPISEYRTLGEFFIRRLRPGARPVDRRPGIVVSPADGHLANFGRVVDGQAIQAKGRPYSVADMLRSSADAERYAQGSWATVYLSPRDYHRVHHPVEGQVVRARYVPGHLWPVNRVAVEGVEDLFCVNERLITFVDTPLGEVATIMVGATSVGHITVAYDGHLETNRGGRQEDVEYAGHRVARGDELGVFHLGSTAVVLFANPEVEVLSSLSAGQPIRMGQAMARAGGA